MSDSGRTTNAGSEAAANALAERMRSSWRNLNVLVTHSVIFKRNIRARVAAYVGVVGWNAGLGQDLEGRN